MDSRQLSQGGPVERFRSPWSQVLAWAWYLIAVIAAVDLFRRGNGRELAVGLTFLALASAAVYTLAQRPAVLVDDTGLLVRNVLHDVAVPWSRVRGIGTRWSLSIRTDDKEYAAWAIAAKNPSRTRGRGARRLDRYDPAPREEHGPVSVKLLDRLDRYQRSAPVPGEVEPEVQVRWALVPCVALAVTAVAFVLALLLT